MQIQVDSQQFNEQGFLIIPGVVPESELEDRRTQYEHLLEKQKIVWARNRKPGEPAGGRWDVAEHPTVDIGYNPGIVDQVNSKAVEIWTQENTLGTSRQLMGSSDVAPIYMQLMCSPVTDHGPGKWHRDIHPEDTAPLEALQKDVEENGPRQVQWNIPLYDDDVLWIIPGSHSRPNTEEENRCLAANPRLPLPGGVPVKLNAGDAVVYNNYLLHWGSNYSTRLRRIVHSTFGHFAYYQDAGIANFLSPSSQSTFQGWVDRSEQVQDATEAALRSVINRDVPGYRAALEDLHPGAGKSGKSLLTIFLSKAVNQLQVLKRPEFDTLPEQARKRAVTPHPFSLCWGEGFGRRFTPAEADILVQRFRHLDARLQSDGDQFEPGFQSQPMLYHFYRMPADADLDSFIADWS